jgi:hypothetical protein
MEAFRNDRESVVLTADEMRSFSEIVHASCYREQQHELSTVLARTIHQRGVIECDGILRECRRMWRP